MSTQDTLSEEQARHLVDCLQNGEQSPLLSSRPFGTDLSLLRPNPSLSKHTARPNSPMEVLASNDRGRQEAVKTSSFGTAWRPRSRSRKRSSGNAAWYHEAEPMPNSSPPPPPSLRERADASRFGHAPPPPALLRTFSHDAPNSPRNEVYQGPRHVSQPLHSNAVQTPARHVTRATANASEVAAVAAGVSTSTRSGIFSRSRRRGADTADTPQPLSSPTTPGSATPRAPRRSAVSTQPPSDAEDISFGCASFKAFDAQYRTLREAKEDEVLISNLMYKSFLDLADPKKGLPQPQRTFIPIHQAQAAMTPVSPDRTASDRTPRPAVLRRFHTDDLIVGVNSTRTGSVAPGNHKPPSSPLSQQPDRRPRSKLRPRRPDTNDSSPLRMANSDPFASAFGSAHEANEQRAAATELVSATVAVGNDDVLGSTARRRLASKSDASLRTKFDPFAVPALPEWAQRANHMSGVAQKSPSKTHSPTEEPNALEYAQQTQDPSYQDTSAGRMRATSASRPQAAAAAATSSRMRTAAAAALANPVLAAVISSSSSASMARTGSDGPRGMPLRDRQPNGGVGVGPTARRTGTTRHAKSGSYSSLEVVLDEDEDGPLSLLGGSLLAYDAAEPELAEIEAAAAPSAHAGAALKRLIPQRTTSAASHASRTSSHTHARGSWSSEEMTQTHSSNEQSHPNPHSRESSSSSSSSNQFSPTHSRPTYGPDPTLSSHDEERITDCFPARPARTARPPPEHYSARPPSLEPSSRDSISSREDDIPSPLTPHSRINSPSLQHRAIPGPALMQRGASLPTAAGAGIGEGGRSERTPSVAAAAAIPNVELSDVSEFGELAMRRALASRHEKDTAAAANVTLAQRAPLSTAAHANALDAIQRARLTTRQHA